MILGFLTVTAVRKKAKGVYAYRGESRFISVEVEYLFTLFIYLFFYHLLLLFIYFFIYLCSLFLLLFIYLFMYLVCL